MRDDVHIPGQTAPLHVPADALPALRLLNRQGGVLAMLTGVEGRFFRAPGATIAITGDGVLGGLSGGCVEGDIAIHARRMRLGDPAITLRYGAGSPYPDIALPCGSGIEVTLAPVATGALRGPLAEIRARRASMLGLAGLPPARIVPPLRIAIFGDGDASGGLARLARAVGMTVIRPDRPDAAQFDRRTAVALLHHDHDHEFPALNAALASDAFWIGAQGSHAAHQARRAALIAAGWTNGDLARIHGPAGLIPRSREAGTLAVSLLAAIVAAAQDLDATTAPKSQPAASP